MRKFTKRTATVAVAAVAVSGVGIAFAAWTSSGSGSGTAQSKADVASTIVAGASAADLYPGAVKTVTVVIDNPNEYPVKVTSISAGSSNAVGSPECAAGSVKSDAVASPPATTIAPNGTQSYTITTRMLNDASNNCKSQTFTLPLTASLVSVANTVGNE